MFVNLSNHALETWSPAQRDAARALGHGEPGELAHPLPLIDPRADTETVVALARTTADEALATGARGAVVAGDYTFTLALVAALQARGVRCYAATTARDVTVERAPDGSSVKRSVFVFVRWREYSLREWEKRTS